MANINLTTEQRKNLLIGALEGGSNYWYLLGEDSCDIIDKFAPCKDNKHLAGSERIWKAIEQGASIPIYDCESEEDLLGILSLAKIEAGEQVMVGKYPSQLANVLNEQDDATTADIWLQCALMGEVVYG